MLSTYCDPAATSQKEITDSADLLRSRFTRKERALLLALRQNPGQCFSRQFLLKTIWGYGEGAKSRTVDVHVARLRRKLGPEAEGRIETVTGKGYYWQVALERASMRDRVIRQNAEV